MNVSSSRIVNFILGLLGILITIILISNGLHNGLMAGDLLKFSGAFMISIGFIIQGILEPSPWYSLIVLQLGMALYLSPVCLKLFSYSSAFDMVIRLLMVLIISSVVFDSIKRIVLHGKNVGNN